MDIQSIDWSRVRRVIDEFDTHRSRVSRHERLLQDTLVKVREESVALGLLEREWAGSSYRDAVQADIDAKKADLKRLTDARLQSAQSLNDMMSRGSSTQNLFNRTKDYVLSLPKRSIPADVVGAFEGF